MQIFQAILLGILQGLGEFLPISSSGHLLVLQRILGIGEPSLALTVLLHLGTLVAVFVVFWRDWWAILKNPFKNGVFWMLVLASIPALVTAVLLKDFVEQQSSGVGSGLLLGICFLITGLLLTVAELWSRRYQIRGRHAKRQRMDSVADVGPKQALWMGGMQAVALLPGISRSGSTIVGGLFAGLSRPTAAKFSFMMSAPAILGSLLFEAKDLFSGDSTALAGGWLPLVIGVVVSGVVGYLAIRWMLRLLEKVPLYVFAVYVGLLGLFLMLDSTVFHWFF